MLCTGQLSVYSVCSLPSVTCYCSFTDRYGMIGSYLPQAHWELFHREKELFFILWWVGGCDSAYVEVGFLFAGVGSSLPPRRSLASNSGL